MDGRGRRVAVTGYGVVAPSGIGRDAFWTGLNGPGITGTRSVSMIDWDPLPYYANPKEARRADKVEQFAIAAAAQALEQAGRPAAPPERIGTIFATGVGGLQSTEEQIEVMLSKGERRVSPFLVPMMMPNAAGAAISMRYGFQGPNETITTACAASTHALGYAARLIAWGLCDAVVSGGSEAANCRIGLSAFGNMTALSTSGASKPFDMDRDGFVLGEGSAVFVLEEWEAAEARGATILAEVLGAGSNADAHHVTAPSPGGVGAIACMRLALAEAGLAPSDIAQVNAHGTSTGLNDAAEAAALAVVFGPSGVPTTSTKGVTGHALGAAGALELAAVLLSFEHGLIPPTAGTEKVDPEFDIDLVLGEARPWAPGPTMSNNFGFGGHNGSIIVAPVS
ncbi:MAG: Beta-ketoacyl synthase [Ilumatobacteraceae bacterium]|nr:Beta-ketoacyl synthase [Ilumatobacteraceae bacterium]